MEKGNRKIPELLTLSQMIELGRSYGISDTEIIDILVATSKGD